MIKKLWLMIILSLVCLPILTEAKDSDNLKKLRSRIHELLHHNKSDVHIGIIVREIKTGRVIYKERSQFLYPPASTQKLFTAIAALHYLGPNFQFSTSLLTNGKIKNKVLRGDLFIKFSGDPELRDQDLTNLIGKLKRLGISRINGNIFIDDNTYDKVPYPAGSVWDDLSYGYAAPINAIIINRNKFLLHLVPSKNISKSVALAPELPANIVHFTNRIKTTFKEKDGCDLTIYSDINNHYRLGGCLNPKWGKQRRTLAIRNPLIYAKKIIKEALTNCSINYNGSISQKISRSSNTLLIEHKSPPLGEMLKEMLKNSDNLITNTLLKKMGQLYYKRQGSWENGIDAIKKILAPTGIDFDQNLINDGAGLSRYNLVSPYQMSKLLLFAYQNPTIRVSLLNALPIAGKDGTLAGRMQEIARTESVHAKTGSMAGVSALAGYIMRKTPQNEPLSFVIMINGFIGKSHPYLQLEDELCKLLATFNTHK